MRTGTKKNSWCEQEDKIICQMVSENGQKGWSKMAKYLHKIGGFKLRTGRQCRERWCNHLDPNIVKEKWKEEEEQLLYELHKKHGGKWTLIAQELPGRSDNAIKNHFYALLRKNLRKINKFLGEKNSSMKIGKIKSSTLSRLFSMGPEERSLCQSLQITNNQQGKQFAYQLLFLSRFNLLDGCILKQKDLGNFHKLLQSVQKMNDVYEYEIKSRKEIVRERKLLDRYDQEIVEDSSQEEQNYQSKLGRENNLSNGSATQGDDNIELLSLIDQSEFAITPSQFFSRDSRIFSKTHSEQLIVASLGLTEIGSLSTEETMKPQNSQVSFQLEQYQQSLHSVIFRQRQQDNEEMQQIFMLQSIRQFKNAMFNEREDRALEYGIS